MGITGWLRRTFTASAAPRTFSYETAPFSQLTNGLFLSLGRASGNFGRDEALEIPAVLRGRNLICNIATLPLEAIDSRNVVVTNPLLAQIDPNVANVVTVAQLVEDLLFDAVAWLRITGFSSVDGWPYSAVRVAPHRVSLQPPEEDRRARVPGSARPRTGYLPSDLPTHGVVWIDGEEVPYSDVIRFDSPNPALMKVIRRTLERAIALGDAAQMYADNPRPADYFRPTDAANGDPVDDDEIIKILDQWAAARRKRSTAYVPAALTYETVQQPTPAELQLAQLGRQVSLDFANALGIDPEDLGISTTSRTYQNATDRRKDRINDVLAVYMEAITQRLSMPDVTKRGVRVRFALADYLRADPRTRAEVAEIQIRSGVIKREWVASVVEGLPPEAIPDSVPGQEPAAPPQRPAINAGEASVGDPMQINASERAPFTFARTELTFEGEAVTATFAVDQERRTITGLIVPWGETARSAGRRWRFERGGLRQGDLRRVKLLRDHDNAQVLGFATKIEDTDLGLVGTFSVAPGPDGDRALALAEHGTLDGLSIGAEWDEGDFIPDPQNPGAFLVRQYLMRETSLTGMPAFNSSRLTSVRASDQVETEPVMPEPTTPQAAPASEPAAAPTNPPAALATAPQAPAAAPAPTMIGFSDTQFAGLMTALAAQAGSSVPSTPAATDPEPRPVVDPTTQSVPTGAAFVSEPLPYRFSYQPRKTGQVGGRHVFATDHQYDFSTDLFNVVEGRADSAALGRVNTMIRAVFDVDTTDVASAIPSTRRPDLWQPQLDYSTPLWDMINSGPTDGTPFEVPKFNSSSGMVTAAVEGVEPAPGAMALTNQTITPTQLWGKVEITRQATRRGGNPQISGIIFDQMLREYFEDREAAVATFLATLTAAADILVTGVGATPTDAERLASARSLERALTGLQFVRGGNRFTAFAVHEALYMTLATAADSTGRPLYPQIAPANANGTTQPLFRTMNIAGTTAVPAWALGAAGGNASVNSWLFDPTKVRGWGNEPERLDWNFGATVQQISGSTGNAPQLSHVTIGILGDVAFANLDINGVRQVVFDQNTAA